MRFPLVGVLVIGDGEIVAGEACIAICLGPVMVTGAGDTLVFGGRIT